MDSRNDRDKIHLDNILAKISVEEYIQKILQHNPYPYQWEIIRAILDSVMGHKGLTFSILLARQMGKNEISALVEACLLAFRSEGTIVKAAPTYKPQIVNSRLRLDSMLNKSFVTQKRVWHAEGYIIGVAHHNKAASSKTGPRVMFLSASPDSNIVGATASLWLEVDEAQDVSVEKFNRDLMPMASTQNATTVLYGTAWSEDTLLEQVKAVNQELEAQDGIRRHFEYNWHTLAALNGKYKTFVEREIRRLGAEHLTIRTQYDLKTINGVGLLLSETQRHMLRGTHEWLNGPLEDDDGYYIAGLDVGGEERQKQGEGQICYKHDSTVLTIARVVTDDMSLQGLEIVHQVQWTGKPYLEQYAACLALCELWKIQRLAVDKTGLGEGLASLLSVKLGEDVVVPFHFTRQSKSKLAYDFLSSINSGHLKMYKEDGAPDDISIEAWKQLKLARYRIPGENLLDMYVAPDEGHDDYLISIALCREALKEWTEPYFETIIIRPRIPYEDRSWF